MEHYIPPTDNKSAILNHAVGDMSGSVTPARRRRDEEYDEEDEEEDVSVDGESTQPGNANKRMRMSNGRDRNHEEAKSGSEV
jgi:hypothetical protein